MDARVWEVVGQTASIVTVCRYHLSRIRAIDDPATPYMSRSVSTCMRHQILYSIR